MIEILEHLPTAAFSRLVGRLARTPVPRPLRRKVWRGVAARLGIELEEVELSLAEYPSFDAFFTRRLKGGARDLEGDRAALVSPADGQLMRFDPRDAGDLVSVKGRAARLEQWLGRDDLPWRRPQVAVVYLSPRSYHRVHTPIAGAVTGLGYRPGCLLPVNPGLVGDDGRVFGRNERVTCWLDTGHGPVAVTLVGALCVGAIELSFADLTTNGQRLRRPFDRDMGSLPVAIPAGAELGVFHMGSSVVVAFEGEGFVATGSRRVGSPIRVGDELGRWKSRAGD